MSTKYEVPQTKYFVLCEFVMEWGDWLRWLLAFHLATSRRPWLAEFCLRRSLLGSPTRESHLSKSHPHHFRSPIFLTSKPFLLLSSVHPVPYLLTSLSPFRHGQLSADKLTFALPSAGIGTSTFSHLPRSAAFCWSSPLSIAF
jgi:hypothetical protein